MCGGEDLTETVPEGRPFWQPLHTWVSLVWVVSASIILHSRVSDNRGLWKTTGGRAGQGRGHMGGGRAAQECVSVPLGIHGGCRVRGRTPDEPTMLAAQTPWSLLGDNSV